MPAAPGPGASGDHCTAGLTRHPALDLTGAPGEPVTVGEGGRLYDAHVIGWKPGFGGYTVYLEGDSGGDYFFTHMDTDRRGPTGRVEAGAVIGYLAPAWAARYIYVIHVHVGSTAYKYPPCSARDCGQAGEPCAAGSSPLELGAGVGGGTGGSGRVPPPPRSRPGGDSAGAGGTGIASAIPLLGDVLGFLNAVVWLFDPRNWLRVVEGLVGIWLLVLGVAVLFVTFAQRDTPTGRAAKGVVGRVPALMRVAKVVAK